MAKKVVRRRAFYAGMLAAKRLPLTAPFPENPWKPPYDGDFREGFTHYRRAGSVRSAPSRRV